MLCRNAESHYAKCSGAIFTFLLLGKAKGQILDLSYLRWVLH